MRREIEILCLVFIGYICVVLGLRMDDIGFRTFFYILSGVFILAIFRPKESP
jgi:hypothetical protein